MLILSRKADESIVIDGHILIKIIRVDRDAVRLGIQAPADVAVHRHEVFEAIQQRKPLPRPEPLLAGSIPGNSAACRYSCPPA